MDHNFWQGLLGGWRFLVNWLGDRGILGDRKEAGMREKRSEEMLQEMNLTREEKRVHARLVQDCRERDRKLVRQRQESEEGIQILTAHLCYLTKAMEIIDQHLEEANDRLADVILLHIPDSKIPHA
jgi:phosphoglycerate-specific signal transduction histidine kinase